MLAEIKVIAHDSIAYAKTVALRDAILRQPLGLSFTKEQLAAENTQIHMAGFSIEEEVLACLILVPMDEGSIKMRQVAVAISRQRKGMGSTLVAFSEDWAKQHGFSLMYCHARDHAVPFYLRLGYTVVGEEFVEVGIPHYRMEKEL